MQMLLMVHNTVQGPCPNSSVHLKGHHLTTEVMNTPTVAWPAWSTKIIRPPCSDTYVH